MSEHASVKLQTKIYELLQGDSTLETYVVDRVYDHVPDQSLYPFVRIGEENFEHWGAHDVEGFIGYFDIHTWTQGEGMKTCKKIQARIYQLLHNIDLSLSGHKTVSLLSGTTTTMLDPDGRTFHGVNRFNLILGGS